MRGTAKSSSFIRSRFSGRLFPFLKPKTLNHLPFEFCPEEGFVSHSQNTVIGGTSKMKKERFSSKSEIKEVLTRVSKPGTAGGPILFVDPKTDEPYCLTSESNVVFLGVTGCGKTRRGTIPMTLNFINKKESFIMIDPKGEVRNSTYCFAKEKGYKIITVNFRDVSQSIGFDLFAYPYELYKSDAAYNRQLAAEIISDIGQCIFTPPGHSFSGKDPFWDNAARDTMEGIVFMLFDHAKSSKEINLESIMRTVSQCEGNRSSSNAFEFLCRNYETSTFAQLLNTIRNAPRDTLGSIVASFFEPLSIFIKNDGIRKLISTDEFKIGDLSGDEEVAIYIVLPDENSNYSGLAAILVSQVISHYIRLAHMKYDGVLPKRMNIVLEELGNIGASLPRLNSIMSAARSRNMRCFLTLQALAQLDDLYGKSKATTILSNADTIVAYRTNHWDTLEELSKKCGEVHEEGGLRREPLISPTELGALELGQALVLISGRIKYVTKLPDYTTLFPMDHWNKPDETFTTKRSKNAIFNLEELVMEIRERRSGIPSQPIPGGFVNPFLTPSSLDDFDPMTAEYKRIQRKLSEKLKKETAKNKRPTEENVKKSELKKQDKKEEKKKEADPALSPAKEEEFLSIEPDKENSGLVDAVNDETEEEKFLAIAERVCQIRKIEIPFYYKIVVYSYSENSNRSLILNEANRRRFSEMLPASRNTPFVVYICFTDGARHFINTVTNLGAKTQVKKINRQ